MLQIDLNLPLSLGILLGLLGATWVYRDGKKRNMDTADMWAIGFFIGFISLPIIGGVIVLFVYFQKRNQRQFPPQ